MNSEERIGKLAFSGEAPAGERRYLCGKGRLFIPRWRGLRYKLVFICVLKFVSISLPPWGRWQSRSRSDTFCEAKSRVTDEVLAVCTAQNSISSSTASGPPSPQGKALVDATSTHRQTPIYLSNHVIAVYIVKDPPREAPHRIF